MATDNNATTERTELDPVFKEVMTRNFGQVSLPIETQVEVSRLPRTMDVLVVLPQPSDRGKSGHRRRSTIFANTIKLSSKAKKTR